MLGGWMGQRCLKGFRLVIKLVSHLLFNSCIYSDPDSIQNEWKTSLKGFSASKCDVGNCKFICVIFSKSLVIFGNSFGNILEFFGNSVGITWYLIMKGVNVYVKIFGVKHKEDIEIFRSARGSLIALKNISTDLSRMFPLRSLK